MKPITKANVEQALDDREFPDFVIQAFNECIVESRINHSNKVTQNDAVERIMKLGNVSRNEVFENKWLDVERYYRKLAGLLNSQSLLTTKVVKLITISVKISKN